MDSDTVEESLLEGSDRPRNDSHESGGADSDGSSTSPKKGWYLGKHAKRTVDKILETRANVKSKLLELEAEKRAKKVEEKQVKRHSFLNEDKPKAGSDVQVAENVEEESVGRTQTAVVVGKLELSELKVRDIHSGYRNEFYVTVSCERSRFKTARLSKLDAGGSGSFADGIEVDIMDIGCDLIFNFYGKQLPTVPNPDKYLGKVIIPLTRLYELNGQELLSKVRNGDDLKHFSFESWFQLYPLEEDKLHYEPAVQGVLNTGMNRPKQPLGDFHVKVILELEHSLVTCAGLNPPFKPMGEFEPKEMEQKHMAYGAARLQRIVKNLKSIVIVLERVRSWENVVVSGTMVAWHTFLTLFAPYWSWPLLFAFAYVFLAFHFPYEKPDAQLILFNDELEKNPDLPDTLRKKLRLLPKVLKNACLGINRFSFRVERLINATNWADSPTTVTFSATLITAAFVFSVGLAALQLFCYLFIPFHKILFYTGLFFLFLPSNLETAVLERIQSARSKSATNDGTTATRNPHIELLINFISNMAARVPDLKEQTHRMIAASQEIKD